MGMEHRIEIEAYHPHALEFLTFGKEGSGPKVFITAGIHGGEATGIWAAREMAAWLKGQAVRGQVRILPVANPAAFRKLTRYSPYDEADLNRIFPGAPEGSPSWVVAHTIWEEALRSDYLVDLHCCGLFGSDYTLAAWQEFGTAKELASKIDLPVVIQSGGTRHQLFVEACYAGIPAVILELAGGQFGGGGGVLNRESGHRAVAALKNLLVRLGVLEGEVPPTEVTFYGKLEDVRALKHALWTPAVPSGALLTEGQVIGDLDGEPVCSPVTGVTTQVRTDSYVFQGHTLCMVAPRA